MRNFFKSLSNKIFNSLSRGKDASKTSGYKNAGSQSQTFTDINAVSQSQTSGYKNAVSQSQTSGYVNENEDKDETHAVSQSQTSGYKNAVNQSQTFTDINAVSPSQTSGYVNENEDKDETPRNIDNYFKGSSITVKDIKEKVASATTGYSNGAFPSITYTTPNKNKRDMKLMSKTDHTITETNSSNLERDNLDFIYQGKNPIPHTVTTLSKDSMVPRSVIQSTLNPQNLTKRVAASPIKNPSISNESLNSEFVEKLVDFNVEGYSLECPPEKRYLIANYLEIAKGLDEQQVAYLFYVINVIDAFEKHNEKHNLTQYNIEAYRALLLGLYDLDTSIATGNVKYLEKDKRLIIMDAGLELNENGKSGLVSNFTSYIMQNKILDKYGMGLDKTKAVNIDEYFQNGSVPQVSNTQAGGYNDMAEEAKVFTSNLENAKMAKERYDSEMAKIQSKLETVKEQAQSRGGEVKNDETEEALTKFAQYKKYLNEKHGIDSNVQYPANSTTVQYPEGGKTAVNATGYEIGSVLDLNSINIGAKENGLSRIGDVEQKSNENNEDKTKEKGTEKGTEKGNQSSSRSV